jgi:hypothetical protein
MKVAVFLLCAKSIMQKVPTPFDPFVLKLSADSLQQVQSGTSDPTKSFVLSQLQLLRVTYINMKNIKIDDMMRRSAGTGPISLETLVLEQPLQSHAAFLYYFIFINTINQFGRALLKHHGSTNPIPRYERIKFFRNKCLEHWDDYSISIPSSGFTWQGGKIPIPITETVHRYDERKEKLVELNSYFADRNIDIQIEEAASGLSTMASYCDELYKALEEIDPELRSGNFDDDLITLLFQFSFPVPIHDIDEYIEELIPALEDYLQ